MTEHVCQPRKYPWWVRVALWAVALGLGVFTVAVIYGLERLNIDRPVTYDRPEDHFKYGSLGGERGYYFQLGFGIPYWIWVALPELFPEHLPDHTPGRGYTSFGYIYEPGKDPRFDLPIGTSRRDVMGIDRVWLNCGVCHTGTVRETPESKPRIVLGMPANRYDQGRWGKFLFDTAVSEKYTGDRFLAKIDELAALRRRLIAEGTLAADPGRPPELSALDRVAFKTLVVPILRIRLLTLRDRLESFIDFTSWGPGRVDTFNSPKALLNFPMVRARQQWPHYIEPELQGNVDFPSVWNQQAREMNLETHKRMQLHWDGNNTSIDERNLSAAFAATIPPVLDKCSLLRFKQFLLTAKPPPFPENHIDRGLAARGEPIYRRYCARCHGGKDPPFTGDGLGADVGTVVPIGKIGTDRRRLDSYTPALAKAQGSLYDGYPLADSEPCPGIPHSKDYPARFSHFRKTHGYANSPLDGIWLRAPYLHNGSVPNLRQLLEPAAKRSRVFWTGYDVYDYDDVGFVTSGPGAEAEGWRYVVRCPGEDGDPRSLGNCNRGHEGPEFGTDLPPGDKDALLEYLKTF